MNYANTIPGQTVATVRSPIESGGRVLYRAKLAFFFLLAFTGLLYGRPEDFIVSLRPLHLAMVVAICAGITYFLARLLGGLPFVWTTELKIMFALTFLFALGVPFAYWRTESLNVLTGDWMKTLIIFVLLTQTVFTLDRVRKLLWVILLCELIASGLSVFILGDIVQEQQVRLGGVTRGLFSGNSLGMGVGLTLPYIAAMMIRARSWIQRGLLAATFGIVMWMVVLTASRGGMVCVLASLCFVWAILVRHSSRGQIIGLLMAAGVLLAIAFAPDVFKDRMRTLWDPTAKEESRIALSADQSSYQRKVLFLRSIQYTLESPLFGLGLGNFAIASGTRTARSSDWMETHNTYTQMSSEAGIPAFLLFAGVTLMTIRRMWRVSKKYAGRSEHAELRLFALATLASMLSFIVGAFFVNMAYSYYLYYVVGISVALQGLAQRAQQEEPAPENDVRRFRNTSKGRFG